MASLARIILEITQPVPLLILEKNNGPSLRRISFLTLLLSFSIYTINYALSQKCSSYLAGECEGTERWTG